jgi:hypothetical protein
MVANGDVCCHYCVIGYAEAIYSDAAAKGYFGSAREIGPIYGNV